jgi:hypothetical protein
MPSNNYQTPSALASMALASTAFAVLTSITIFSSCSTDVELNAPYHVTPVIFGLLDAAQDTQWVRINRTWLGDGNQYDAATITDSSQYDPAFLEPVVTEVLNGVEIRNWTLRDTLLQDKEDDGIFFAPEHQMWYFVPEDGLNTDADYDLRIDFADGTWVYSTTNMIAVQEGNITQPPPGVDQYKFSFANIGFATLYPDINLKWSSTAGASRYEAVIRVHVTERIYNDLGHTDLAMTVQKTIDLNVGFREPEDDEGGEVLRKEINGRQFYLTLAAQLDADPYVRRVLGEWDEVDQIARACDFHLVVANEQLATYIDVNMPVTGVIQERPEYTNIQYSNPDISGIGLWASRASQGVYGIGFTSDSMEELVEGEMTGGLNFCSPNPFSDYSCD